jgi:flagellar export protein FliJ
MTDYPLTVLLKIRETEKDSAVATYAQASNLRAQARDALERLKAEKARLVACRDRAREQRTDATEVLQIRAFSDYVLGLEREQAACDLDLSAAARDLERAEAALSEARRNMAKAETELNAVVSHQEKWQQERRAELAKKAAEALDDLAIQRWSQS